MPWNRFSDSFLAIALMHKAYLRHVKVADDAR
jgi:hypothetical protein